QMTAQRPLAFFAHGAAGREGLPDSHYEALQRFRDWGLPVSPEVARVDGVDGCLAYYAALQDKRGSLPYEIDGVVYKVDQRREQETLGFVSRAPRWALAHKFPAQEEITRLLAIDVSVGRTGVSAP
ncbi:MAG: NAD-dependent DNA ligase LigA, partial [Xanthomonadales bacterium]|nr:NAD-dependent DNA ligase LigA [Xanthomonadales bacterium]